MAGTWPRLGRDKPGTWPRPPEEHAWKRKSCRGGGLRIEKPQARWPGTPACYVGTPAGYVRAPAGYVGALAGYVDTPAGYVGAPAGYAELAVLAGLAGYATTSWATRLNS